MTDQPAAIECQNVSFAAGGRTVLRDVSFAVPQGAYVGIVGPNGGGKTTLLKLILGILQPQSGAILIGGKTADAASRGAIGYVPQRLSQREFAFPATVEEIVRGGRRGRGLLRRFTKEDELSVDRALETAGIAHLRGRRIADLSGGESQKAYIARALAAEPRTLLLDEPSTGVDLPSREGFDAFLAALHRDHGLTIAVVSHDLEALSADVDSLLCVNGAVLDHCSPECFLEGDAFKKLYGDKALLIAHHHHH